MSILSSSSISIRLHSGTASAIPCSEGSLSKRFKPGSVRSDKCPWFGLSCFNSLRYRWEIVIKGSALSREELI